MSGSSSIIENTRSITSLNSLGESKEAAIGYEPEVVPPAPEEVAPPAEVVPPARGGEERRVAGLRADVERDGVAAEGDDDEDDEDGREVRDDDRDGADDDDRDDEDGREAVDDDRDGVDDGDEDRGVDEDRDEPDDGREDRDGVEDRADVERAEPDVDRDDAAREEAGLRAVEEDAPAAILRVP